MDFHALQHKLFEMDPSDPREDLAKLQAQAQNGGAGDIPPTKDYVNESVEVPQGSMPLGIDSLSDFAALAGVTETQKTGSAGQAKGKDPMPAAQPGRTKHPLKDKLVGEHDIDPVSDDTLMGEITDNLEMFGSEMGLRGPYLDAWLRYTYDAFLKIKFKQDSSKRAALPRKANERSLTKGEETEKERLVKGMKKNKDDFKKRYGKDAEAVMYATATKNAKNESIKEQLLKALNEFK